MKLSEIEIGEYYTYATGTIARPKLKAAEIGINPRRGHRYSSMPVNREVRCVGPDGKDVWVKAVRLQSWASYERDEQTRAATEEKTLRTGDRLRGMLSFHGLPGSVESIVHRGHSVQIVLTVDEAVQFADWLER